MNQVVTFLIAGILALLVSSCHGQSTIWNTSFASSNGTTTFGDPYTYRLGDRWAVVVFVTCNNQSRLVAMELQRGTFLWTASPTQHVAVAAYSGWCDGLTVEHKGVVLYCGMDDGVVAINGTDGTQLWRYVAPGMTPTAATPVHPTAVPSSSPSLWPGFIAMTLENGLTSSWMYIVRADTGALITITTGERVFTKIWHVQAVPDGIALCSMDNTGNISVSVRRLLVSDTGVQLVVVWMHANLSYSPPGLWDNPNLDVDQQGATLFMYTKPHIGDRVVFQFNSTTGEVLWSLPTKGTVIDYDTFAYQGNFYRLITANETTGDRILIQGFNRTTVHGDMYLSVNVPCNDSNAILLVGGPKVAAASASHPHDTSCFVVGLGSGSLWYITTGLVWALQDQPGISTATIHPDGGSVLFGTAGSSSFQAVRLHDA